jgi:hypothetical protein
MPDEDSCQHANEKQRQKNPEENAQDTKSAKNLKAAKRQEETPIEDDPKDAELKTQATATEQPSTPTEYQKVADVECEKFISACATVFEDAWTPVPHESPHEPYWITAARHGLNILALQHKKEATQENVNTQTEVTKM